MLTQDTVLQCPGPPPVVETHGRQSRAPCVSGIPERYESADAGIEYQVANTVADEKFLLFEMHVRIAWMRAEGICRHVLMQFDAQAKVCLWQEVDCQNGQESPGGIHAGVERLLLKKERLAPDYSALQSAFILKLAC